MSSKGIYFDTTQDVRLGLADLVKKSGCTQTYLINQACTKLIEEVRREGRLIVEIDKGVKK
jgi:hypothetical protein